MFTDINAAIEEACFLSGMTNRVHVVIQNSMGMMSVRYYKKGDKPMFKTSGKGTVNTGGVAV